ncbi:HCaRG [Plasmopara halstedii]|uniref:HCaRG n=1 Tax=Plasmopara halstedii TaxID=4781 RepID=A0A0P1A7H9_PLAHL|nr:HCaRG [Plasmopara halstedii]CEG36593.1 HCaRG [Plasmopara halstedii]|eukprot:XP_024572962.1 HCaRG [Plasmopara halstedii]
MSRVDERVLDGVVLTNALSTENFEELCKLAIRLFGTDKQSKRRLTRAALACGWESEQTEQAVLVIAKILMDGTKADMSEHAFRAFIREMTLLEKHVEVLAQAIRECVSRDKSINIPRYQNLEWRIDLELGTRFHRHKPKPVVTLRLDTATQDCSSTVSQTQSTCLRVNYDGLKLMQRQLETALKEVDSIHCSRIQRFLH